MNETRARWENETADSPKREPAMNGLLARMEKECHRLAQNANGLASRLDGVTSPAVQALGKDAGQEVERGLPPLLGQLRERVNDLQQCNAQLESILSRLEI